MTGTKKHVGKEKKKLNTKINELMLDMMEDFANNYVPKGSRVFLVGTKEGESDFTLLRTRDLRELIRKLEERLKE